MFKRIGIDMSNKGKEQFKVYSKNGNAIGKVENLTISSVNTNNKSATSSKWQIASAVIALLAFLWAIFTYFA